MNKQTFKIRDLRRKEKFFIDDDYLNGWAKLLKPTATAVYLSLCRHADKEQSCFPSMDLISKQHSISRKTVQRAINKLKDFSLIKTEQKRNKNGKWLQNIYYLLDKSMWKKTVGQNDYTGNRGSKKSSTEGQKRPTTEGQTNPNKVTHIKDTQLRNQHEANASGFKKLSNLVKSFRPPEVKQKGAIYKWQDTAVRWWQKLNLDNKPPASWFRIFKLDAKKAELACSWASDSGADDLEKLVYWGFNQLRKHGKIIYKKKEIT